MKVKLTTLLSGILLLVLTPGCENNSPIDGTSPVSGGDAGQGACFSVMRAPEALPGETELPEHAFSLWAWQRDSTESAEASGVFDYVDALWVGTERTDGTVDPEFVYLRANSLWSTDKEHLWPDNYIACDFFGIYPADAATLDVSPRSGSHRPVRSISYDTSLSHYDLLVTSAMGKKEKARADGSLPLTFHHVLSKVGFKACRDDHGVVVLQLSVEVAAERHRQVGHAVQQPTAGHFHVPRPAAEYTRE